jgi:hypothetical protein
MKVIVLVSATALATVLAFSPASARLGIAPMASTQDDAMIQVRGGGHGHGHHSWHGGRGHHYGWYRGHGNWRHHH